MQVSISNGNVSLDTTYDNNNIVNLNTQMITILNNLKQFDATQINALSSTLNTLYPTLVSFTQFLDQWEQVFGKVVL